MRFKARLAVHILAMGNKSRSFIRWPLLAAIFFLGVFALYWRIVVCRLAPENFQHRTAAGERFKAQQTALRNKYWHALGLIRGHRYPEAMKELQEVIAKDPFPNSEAHIALAHAAKYFGEKELAARSYLQAVAAEQKEGDGIRAYYDLEAGEYLERIGRRREANEIYQKCVEAWGHDRFSPPREATHKDSASEKAFTMAYAAQVQKALEGRDAAAELYLRALALAPNNDWLVLTCAEGLSLSGRYEEVLNLEHQLLHSGNPKIVGFAKPITDFSQKYLPVPRHLRVGRPARLKSVATRIPSQME